MDIEGIRSAQALNAQATTSSSDELGKNQFLELMIAQMNNQDPLDPAKNEDFIAQLAQFSTVEGIENMNKSIGDMSAALQSSLTVQASSLVGRSVLVPSNAAYLGPNGLTGSIDVPETAGSVTVDITTPSGELVRQVELGPQAAGAMRFKWDGTDDVGELLPEGVYGIQAFSQVGPNRQALTLNMPDQVVSVSIDEAGVFANLASGGSVAASQIKEIQ